MRLSKLVARLVCISFTCGLFLMAVVPLVAFASTAQQSVADADPCPVLAIGSADDTTGGKVSILQYRLKYGHNGDLGQFGKDHTGIDGIFGPVTKEAVETYQQAQHITVDGIVGPQTWATLNGCEWPDLPSSHPVVQLNPNTFTLNVGDDTGVKGSATFTFKSASEIVDITMSVQDTKCDSNDVYIQLRIHSKGNGGTHSELKQRNSNGCHASAATWHSSSYTNNVANSAGDLSIEGVDVQVCVDDFGNDTCKPTQYADNPFVSN